MEPLLGNDDSMARDRDWRKALRSQPAYRIYYRTLRGQSQIVYIVFAVCFLGLLWLFFFSKKPFQQQLRPISKSYNHTYPLTMPIRTQSSMSFRIGLIADLDTKSRNSKNLNTWNSFLLRGYLTIEPVSHRIINVFWNKGGAIRLSSGYALNGRGMELSELQVFDGRLLTFDDRTGLVFELLDEDHLVPWIVLADGDGRTSIKGFKSEWACVKDQTLIVGSMGKEWTTASGKFEHHNPQWVKEVSVDGAVAHLNWVSRYEKLRESVGIHFPGYMIHESGAWSGKRRRWYFLPRRCSRYRYNETLDEHRSCSLLLSIDEHFMGPVQVTPIFTGQSSTEDDHKGGGNTRGFSAFRFIPGMDDQVIVALRTEEVDGQTASYLMAFTIDGRVLLPDQFIDNVKYEGLEFI